MKHKLEFLNQYFQKTGVQISILVTLVSTIFMICTLSIKELSLFKYETIGLLSLIFEFGYGTTLSFLILRKRNKYLHLTPFLMLNWIIGCFSLNVLIPIFQDLPVWIYISTFTFCLSNFFLYQKTTANLFTIIIYFINGVTFWTIFYFAIFLIPATPYSILGILAL